MSRGTSQITVCSARQLVRVHQLLFCILSSPALHFIAVLSWWTLWFVRGLYGVCWCSICHLEKPALRAVCCRLHTTIHMCFVHQLSTLLWVLCVRTRTGGCSDCVLRVYHACTARALIALVSGLCSVWAVAESSCVPGLVASASDDGTVALWSGPGLATRAATLMPAGGQPVTSVDFCNDDEHSLLMSASDGNAYVYDLRNRCGFFPTYKHLHVRSHARGSVPLIRGRSTASLLELYISGCTGRELAEIMMCVQHILGACMCNNSTSVAVIMQDAQPVLVHQKYLKTLYYYGVVSTFELGNWFYQCLPSWRMSKSIGGLCLVHLWWLLE